MTALPLTAPLVLVILGAFLVLVARTNMADAPPPPSLFDPPDEAPAADPQPSDTEGE